ncbi:MAG: hypothetical protein IJ109_00395 [Firmicutes bacterium]|nr:hypothetical protein [Bacillota bacterium]
MIRYEGSHPWEQYFTRFFDKGWTQSGSPYYFQIIHDKKGNPSNLQCFYKEQGGGITYAGTYKILRTEEINGDNYVVLRRMDDEPFDDIKPCSDDKRLDNVGDIITARYYPTGWYRLELMPPVPSISERLLKEFDESSIS